MMKTAIVFSSRTGNTKLLAETIRDALPQCSYFGPPSEEALDAHRIYVGFWTDRGRCNRETAEFLNTVTDQQIFLFGTAGFGGNQAYFDKILKRTHVPGTASVIGSFLCQGKMPPAVRQRYEKMQQKHIPHMKRLIENFDRALTHPDREDLEALRRQLETVNP